MSSDVGRTVFHIASDVGAERKFESKAAPLATSSAVNMEDYQEEEPSCAQKCGNCWDGLMECLYHKDSSTGSSLFCYQTPSEWVFILSMYGILWTGIGLFMWGMLEVHAVYGVASEWAFLVIFLASVFLLLLGLLLGERERRKEEHLARMKDIAEKKYNAVA